MGETTTQGSADVLGQGETGLFGPRGWTARCGVVDLLAPFLETWRGPGVDFARFGGLGEDEARALVEVLPRANLADRQNDAPRVSTLLEAACGAGGEVEVYGYLVGAARWDERVSLDAVVLPGAPGSREEGESMTWGEGRGGLWERLSARFRLADGASPPDELVWMPRGATQGPAWWLWWD